MKNKAIILDRDGTINVDYGYVYELNKLVFIDGVIEALKMFSENGYKLYIVTNQSGIGRGIYTIKEYNLFTKKMLFELNKNNIYIDDIYYCPHTSEDRCECRKPSTKLFEKLMYEHNIDVNKSYVIGDKERDIKISDKNAITGILLSDKKNEKYITKKNLLEAAKYIINEK